MKQSRQLIVSLDIALLGVGIMKALVGLVCALAVGAWLHAWMVSVFVVGALVLVRSMYWPSLLALIAAAYADWPARQWLGVELSEYVTVQALVAVPLWLVVLDYPERLEGRAKIAAGACCITALVSGLAAPWLDGAYWLVAAPLSFAAFVALIVRMVRHRVPLATRGWICAAAIIPSAGWLSWFVLVPGTPYPGWLMVSLNLWLSLAPLLLAVMHWRRREQGRDSRMGMGPRRVRGGKLGDVLGRVQDFVRRVVRRFGYATRRPASVPGSGARAAGEVLQVRGVRWHPRSRNGSGDAGDHPDSDRAISGAHGAYAALRSATGEPVDLGTGPLPVQERVG